MKKILFTIFIMFLFISNVKAFEIDMTKIDLNAKSNMIVDSFDLNYEIDTQLFNNSITYDREAVIYAKNLVTISFEDVEQSDVKTNLFQHLDKSVGGTTAAYTDTYVSQLFDNQVQVGEISDIKTASFNEENVMVFIYTNNSKVKGVNKNIVLNYWLKYKNGKYTLYLPWITFSNEINEYFDKIGYNEELGNYIGYSYNHYVLDGNVNNVNNEVLNRLFDENKESVVYVSAMKDSLYTNGSGFFIRKGVIATSWSLFLDFLNNGDYLYINDFNGNTYDILGIVAANPDYDVVLLKISEEIGKEVMIGNSDELYANANLYTINSKNNSGFSINYGVNISYKNGKLKNLLPLADGDVGSALFNEYGEVVGFGVRDKLNSELSYANSTNSLKAIQSRLLDNKYSDIKYVSLNDFKNKYYWSLNKEKKINKVSDKVWKKINKIGSLDENIELELLKANYNDRILSLRYANKAKGMLDSIYLASKFTDELLQQGFELTFYNDQKTIYKSDEYQVILKDNFDYLIIIIMEM